MDMMYLDYLYSKKAKPILNRILRVYKSLSSKWLPVKNLPLRQLSKKSQIISYCGPWIDRHCQAKRFPPKLDTEKLCQKYQKITFCEPRIEGQNQCQVKRFPPKLDTEKLCQKYQKITYCEPRIDGQNQCQAKRFPPKLDTGKISQISQKITFCEQWTDRHNQCQAEKHPPKLETENLSQKSQKITYCRLRIDGHNQSQAKWFPLEIDIEKLSQKFKNITYYGPRIDGHNQCQTKWSPPKLDIEKLSQKITYCGPWLDRHSQVKDDVCKFFPFKPSLYPICPPSSRPVDIKIKPKCVKNMYKKTNVDDIKKILTPLKVPKTCYSKTVSRPKWVKPSIKTVLVIAGMTAGVAYTTSMFFEQIKSNVESYLETPNKNIPENKIVNLTIDAETQTYDNEDWMKNDNIISGTPKADSETKKKKKRKKKKKSEND